MRAPINNYTVKFESEYADEVVTESGIKLYRDTSFNPENFAQTNGTVTATPRYNSIPMGIVPGDQVYFSYQVVMDIVQRDRDTPIHKNMLFYKGQKHWVVNNELIYFKTRNGVVEMLNGYMLLDVIEEEIKSTLIIPEYLKKQKLIGSARIVFTGDEAIATKNDVVFYDKRFVEIYELFGKEFYILQKQRILAKL